MVGTPLFIILTLAEKGDLSDGYRMVYRLTLFLYLHEFTE